MKKSLTFFAALLCSIISTSLFGMLTFTTALKKGYKTQSVRHCSLIVSGEAHNHILQEIKDCSKELNKLEQSIRVFQDELEQFDIYQDNTCCELNISKACKESKKISQYKLRAQGLLGYAHVIKHLCSTVKKKTHDWNKSDIQLQSHLVEIASIDYILHGLTCDLRTIHSNCHDLEMIAKNHTQWAAKE